MINDLPTVFEMVTERKLAKEKSSMDSGSKSRHSSKVKLPPYAPPYTSSLDVEIFVQDEISQKPLYGALRFI